MSDLSPGIAGSAGVRMVPNFTGFAAKVKEQLSGIAKSASDSGKRVASSLVDPLKIAAGVGLERAGEAVLDFGKESVQAYESAEQAAQKLSDAYERFPKLHDVTRASLDKLSESLAEHTKFSKEDYTAAQAQLAQYNLTGRQLQQITPLVADFAARTGRDLPEAAAAVGKALLGNTRALKDIGINYKSTHNAAKDYANIQDLLAQKVGGFAEKQGKTASGQLAIMSHQFEELKVQIGAALVPILSVLLKALQPLFPVFNQIVDVVGRALQPVMGAIGQAFGEVIKAILPLLDPLAKLLLAFLPIIPVVAQLASVFISALVPVLVPVISWLAKLVAALLHNKTILEIVGVAVLALAGPFGILGTVVAVVAALIIKHWTAIKNFLLHVVHDVVEFFKKHWPLIIGIITGPIGIIVVEIIKHWTAIKNFVSKVVDDVLGFLKRNWPLIVSIITGPIGALVIFVVRHFTQIHDFIFGILEKIKKVVSSGVDGIVRFFEALPGRILNFLASLPGALYNMGKNIVEGLINGIKSLAGDVVNALLDLLPGPLRKFAGFLGIGSPSKVFAGFGKNIVQGLINGISDHAKLVENAMSQLASKTTLGKITPASVTVGRLTGTSPSLNLAGAFGGASGSIDSYFRDLHAALQQRRYVTVSIGSKVLLQALENEQRYLHRARS